MSSSPYTMFATDSNLETKGIKIDYGPFYFMIARAGGTNTKFRTNAREKLAPFQRAIELGQMDDATADKLTGEAFAESVLLGWGSTEFGEGKIAGPDGKPVDYSVEAAKAMFTALPELLKDLMVEAQKLSNFRKVATKGDGKN